MKKYLWTLPLAALVAAYGCSESGLSVPPFQIEPETTDPETPDEPDEPDAPDAPAVLFFDDFDGKRVSPRLWKKCEWNTPVWAYFLGHFSLEQHVVEGGNLCLRAVDPLLYGGELEEAEKPGGKKWHPWTYGINTLGTFSFLYGEIQVRAKFSKAGPGAWPAIWLMPVDEYNQYTNPGGVMWPEGGEVDIMERWDKQVHLSHAIHFKSTDGRNDRSKVKVVYASNAGPELNMAEYNTYGVRKSPDKLAFIINGVVTQTWTRQDVESSGGKWPFEEREFYIILNHACASTKPYGMRSGIQDWLPSTDYLPYEMLVDWVRVTELPQEADTDE